MERAIATVFGLGNLKPASGTWASAVAILIGYGIYYMGSFPLLALSTVIVTLLGFWSVERYTAVLADKDPSEVVIDEVAGQWIALCFTTFAFWYKGFPTNYLPYPAWLAPFIFFRIFDIWKPWIIGRADRRGDAKGVMLDDIWAGLFAGVACILAAGIYHGIMLRG